MKTVILKLFLLSGALFFANQSFAQNPVRHIERGNLKKIQSFVKKGGDLSSEYVYYFRNEDGENIEVEGYLLNYAYAFSQMEIFEWLLQEIKELPNYTEQISSCLTQFADDGDLKNLERFLEMGADINLSCWFCNDNYPLHQALQCENKDVIYFILSLKPDLHTRDYSGRNILYYSILGEHFNFFIDFVELHELDIWEGHPDESLLFTAAGADHSGFLFYLLEEMASDSRFDPEMADEDGLTLLHYAAVSTEENIRLVLPHVSDVNSRDSEGSTPLHNAAATSLENLTLLISEGASPFIKNNLGMNILHVAALTGNSEVVHYSLHTLGLNADELTNDRYSPILLAVYGGDLKTVKTIHEFGYDQAEKKRALRLAKRSNKVIHEYLKSH